MPLFKPPFNIEDLRRQRDKQIQRDRRINGMLYVDIARKYQISRWTVYRVCKKDLT